MVRGMNVCIGHASGIKLRTRDQRRKSNAPASQPCSHKNSHQDSAQPVGNQELHRLNLHCGGCDCGRVERVRPMSSPSGTVQLAGSASPCNQALQRAETRSLQSKRQLCSDQLASLLARGGHFRYYWAARRLLHDCRLGYCAHSGFARTNPVMAEAQ